MAKTNAERCVTMLDSRVTGPWRVALLASVSAAFLIGQLGVADAQFFGGFHEPRQNTPSRPKQDTPSRSKTANSGNTSNTKARKGNRTGSKQSKKDSPIRHPFGENMPRGPLQLMVSINEQRAVLYSNGIRISETRVSSGTPGHPTPTGVFSVIQKDRWHRSNLYGAAPMFYMHRLTWSGIALHEGYLPGHAASHGCIRMPTDFVSRLWSISGLGMRVVVARPLLTPQEFAHAKLFVPAVKPADTTRTSEAPEGLRPSFETTGQGPVRLAQAETIATNSAVASDAPSVPASSIPSVAGSAEVPANKLARQGRVAIGGEASAITSPTDAAAAPAPTDTVAAPAVPATDVAVTPEVPANVTPATATDVAATPAVPAAAISEPATTSAVTVPAEAPVPAAATADVPAASGEPARPAIEPNELNLPRPAPLRNRTAEPVKMNGHVAVFISGKEKRIYVRHAFVPVFDMPIEIANPGRSLGTHTFTALGVMQDGRMRWNLVSMPVTAGHQAVASKKGKQQPQRKSGRGAVVTNESSSAAEALDRVNIPPAALERIAELLTPGSSLLISDEGLGRETGRATDFIVETR